MPEHSYEQTKSTNGSPQHHQQTDQPPSEHPSQPLEIQPDGTWILGRGADRWMPTKNQIGDLRWVVERDMCNELGVPPRCANAKEKIEFHKRQLALLGLAREAPRCEHVFTDGRCCKAPRVKKGKLCYAHTLMEEKRPVELNLPPLEDPNAVALWLMDVLRKLAEGRISEKTAGVMFYGLQLAMVNARLTTFKETNHAEMVRKAPKNRRDRASSPTSPSSEAKVLPRRTQRNTEDITAKDAEDAKDRRHRAEAPTSPTSEGKELPQRSAEEDYTAEVAEIAEKEEQRGLATETPQSEEKAVLDAEVNPGLLPHHAKTPRAGDPGLPPHHAKTPRAGDPGVESSKSLFSGVEVGEGVADERTASGPSEPPRKSSQSEGVMVTKEAEHHLRG